MHRLSELGLTLPLIAAPMAGGPTTVALVRAAASAGGMGFVAGGYTDAATLTDEVDESLRSSIPFGVNLFAPNPQPVDRGELARYARTIAPEAERFGLTLSSSPPVEDDDSWSDKIDVLLSRPVPAVSFTFGIPAPDVVARLRTSGALLIQTVTSVDEAKAAAEAGLDALAVQAVTAGGHSGTLTPLRPPAPIPIAELVIAVRRSVSLPVIAAGGIATAQDVTAAIRAGADAVAVGTVLLRADEAGTSATHRAALSDPMRRETVVTHAFTGRPARGLRNDFIDRYESVAPFGYPAIHHLTSPLRKAAAASGDADRLHLWAGTGYRHATDEPAATILGRLAQGL
jgi:NAD(P)H-dependent flavin oxidoreductase YrpB (nitropropane dioxygenase family)